MRADSSGITLCLSARSAICLTAVAALALAATGCGGDDEPETATRPPETAPARPAPAPVTIPPPETTATEPARDPDAEPRTVPPDEHQGDEEPIRSEAVFTGRGGRLGPRVVRVPAYIAVRVILRSTGPPRPYTLAIGGQRLSIGPGRPLDEAELPGLLPNRSYAGRSPQGDVRVVASAEPGP